MLLHAVTLGGGESVELHREGDRAVLVLRSATGREVLRIPFDPTPENVRGALQAVARVQRRFAPAEELRQRAEEVRRAAWDQFGEADFDTGAVLAAEILRALAHSMSNKRIAQVLGVSPETVKWHLRNVYSKLGVVGRDDAVARARDFGLLS